MQIKLVQRSSKRQLLKYTFSAQVMLSLVGQGVRSSVSNKSMWNHMMSRARPASLHAEQKGGVAELP